MASTYRDLVRPIPAKINLVNISSHPAAATCSYCAHAVPDRSRARKNTIKTSYERIDEYPEFPGLKSTAKAGCALCHAIRKAIRRSWAVRPMEEWDVGPLSEKDEDCEELLQTRWDRKVRIHSLKFRFEPLLSTLSGVGDNQDSVTDLQRGGMVTKMTLEFGPITPRIPEGAEDSGQPLHGEIGQILSFKAFDSADLESKVAASQRRLPSPLALSPQNVEMMLGWIDACKSNHPDCGLPSSAKSWLPTRLIDVGLGPELECPRLVQSEDLGLGEQASYAALSHMWGGQDVSPPLRTLTHNYRVMLEGIEMRSLPRNFADAVVTCRQLGIPYLWIDSLCIIQDCTSDWEKEAGTMHEVYRSAVVTIVATSATSSHDGFLDRDLGRVPADKFQYHLDGGHGSGSMILTPVDDLEAGLRRGDIDNSKWNTRGWTWQERSLSTRSIHFCKNKIYFECRACLASEENEPEKAEPFDPFQIWPRKTSPPMNTPAQTSSEREIWYQAWKRAVIGYSRRSLTVDSDKLVAIKSVAQDMKRNIGDVYLPAAGMWTGDLRKQMLWYMESGIPRRPAKYRAPSWSWASLDARIGFVKGSRSGEPLGGEDVEIIPLAPKVSSERQMIRVKALRKHISLITPADDSDWNQASFPYYLSDVDGTVFAHGILDMDNRDDLLAGERSYTYLHLADDHKPSGLILMPCSEPNPHEESVPPPDEFVRVGVATIFRTSGELIHPGFFQESNVALAPRTFCLIR